MRKSHFLRNIFIILGSIVVTSLSIFAADHISHIEDAYLGNVTSSLEQRACDDGMTLVKSPKGDFCIDTYEVSTSASCQFSSPRSAIESLQNLEQPSCRVVSVANKKPWTNITHTQAIEACAKVGKHLATNAEWYISSLGTPDQGGNSGCNIEKNWREQGIGATGSGISCKSNWGAYDMIGNVWEWTYETVHEGIYNDRSLPEPGYVSAVSEDGIPTATEDEPSALYYDDRFWIDTNAHTAIFRGGFWNSENEAGRFSVHAGVPASFSGEAVGFRCATRL